jgi:hypothetical protein
MNDRQLKQHERRAELFDETAAPTPVSAAVAQAARQDWAAGVVRARFTRQ